MRRSSQLHRNLWNKMWWYRLEILLPVHMHFDESNWQFKSMNWQTIAIFIQYILLAHWCTSPSKNTLFWNHQLRIIQSNYRSNISLYACHKLLPIHALDTQHTVAFLAPADSVDVYMRTHSVTVHNHTISWSKKCQCMYWWVCGMHTKNIGSIVFGLFLVGGFKTGYF